MKHLDVMINADNADIFDDSLRMLVQMGNISDRVLRGSLGGAV